MLMKAKLHPPLPISIYSIRVFDPPDPFPIQAPSTVKMQFFTAITACLAALVTAQAV